ncbi:MAG: peptidase M23 [Rhodospirillaceae bacterium]|jgi:murein DD-endopeptidase MepM/ murein hydrolase activator NlpD|nr:peptidase M23 [Rhodospirillaceae bacterium]
MPPLTRPRPFSGLLFLFAVLLALGGCGAIEWPPPGLGPRDINTPPPAAPGSGSVSSPAFVGAGAVVAGRGDTVYALSRRHRVPVRAIIEANGLRPPYHLKAGQKVILPRGRQHTVRRGETLYGIARLYRINPYALARANGLRPPYPIRAGQRLVLPGSAGKAIRTASAGAVSRRPTSGQKTSPPPPAVPRPPPASGKGFIWPVKGRVVSGFGAKARGLRNDGINIAAARGAPVKAAENGVIAYAGNELRGFGNLLLIKHSGGWVSAYAHTGKMLVKRGDRVRKGQRIATVGSTGNVKNPQLHFELRRGNRVLDPRKLLRGA